MLAKTLINILKKHPNATILVVNQKTKNWTENIWIDYDKHVKSKNHFAIDSK